jgi:hypothetical protein
MIPNTYTERSVREHCRELQSEAEHQRMLANLHRPSSNWIQCYAGRLGEFFVALGSNLKEFEKRGRPVIYDL